VQIVLDDLSGPEVAELLGEHLRDMAVHSPPESVHALNLDSLRQPDISFWALREGGALLGCAALRQLDASHGEIKSMRTARAHLRRGVAARLLSHILDEARRRGYTRLSLETGSAEAFRPAHGMYARFGFIPCGPFGDYVEDPYSIFMTLEL
jgi:putative acetyltransferase